MTAEFKSAEAKDSADNFEEVEYPDADVVTMGDASYTKMLGRIW
jgi:hypothetical protein